MTQSQNGVRSCEHAYLPQGARIVGEPVQEKSRDVAGSSSLEWCGIRASELFFPMDGPIR